MKSTAKRITDLSFPRFSFALEKENIMPKTFYDYFSENMRRLHLPPPPRDLFPTAAAAVVAIKEIAAALEAVGGGSITIGELIGAGLATEQLAIAASVGASFYLGACIGSFAVALCSVAKGYSCVDGPSASIGGLRNITTQYRIPFPTWLQNELFQNPALLGGSRSAAVV
jgi:hypothetical protein